MQKEKKKLIFKLIVLICIILVVVILFLIFNPSDYQKIENKMKEAAEKYIADNYIEVTNQEFLTLNTLNITDGVEFCSQASGVVVTNVSGKIKYSPYLKCLDYESDIVRNTKNYIELNGEEVVLVNAGAMYFDEGYTLKKEVEVEQVGEALEEPGAYTINYVVKSNGKQKTVIKRIVIVSSVDTSITSSGLIDKEQPVINLKGEKEIYLSKNTKYEEAGYSAYDYEDGNITRKVKVDGEVDSNKEGIYQINYSVKNSRGISSLETRTIHVVSKISDLKVELTTDNLGAPTNASNINIKISGEGFEYLILPNGSKTDNVFTYTVKSNGNYVFKVVDVHGNSINKSIIIDNIDTTAPTGSCKVSENNDGAIIEVEARDESGIGFINYIVNENDSGFLHTTKYTTKEKIKKASVILKDVAGNTTTVNCDYKN